MPRRKRIVAVALTALLVGAGTAGIVLASSGSDGGNPGAGSSASGFTPGKIEGKWTGEWENRTFDTTGGIRANVQTPGNRLVPLADFGGRVFGCSNPPAAVESLTKGSGKDTWNAGGFRVTDISPAFGKLNITYNFASREFTGSGSDPSCNPDITYTIEGKLNPGGFNATVKIDLGSQVATTKLLAKKAD